MTASALILHQLCIMAVYMMVGYILYKTKVITAAGSKELAAVLVKLIIPAVIVNSFCTDFSPEKAKTLGMSAVVGALLLAVSILVARVFFPKKPIEQFSTAFSNAGFMGLPLIQAALGSEGSVLIIAFIVLLNLLQISYGVGILSKTQEKPDWGKLFRNPILLGSVLGVVLFVSGLATHLPAIAMTTLQGICALNTPLAMIVLGTYLAKEKLSDLATTPALYLVCVVRQLVIPLTGALVLLVLPVDFTMKYALLIAASCPVGANVAVYAQLYDQDYAYAGQAVVLSTLLSMVTLPLVVLLGGMLFQ